MITHKQLKQMLLTGAVATTAGAAMKVFDAPYAPYVFSVGAALIVFFQLQNSLLHRDGSAHERRVATLGFLTSLALGAGAYFMFKGSQLWVVAILIYAVTAFYLSFRQK